MRHEDMSSPLTNFLNVDIDLRGDAGDVATFLRFVESSVVVLLHSGGDASIEIAKEYKSLDLTILEMVGLIETLSPEAKTIWKRLEYRRANIGIQAGAEPYAAEFAISAMTLEAIAALGFEIKFTVYAPTTD